MPFTHPRPLPCEDPLRKPRILVVEDEPAIRMGLCEVMVFHGWEPPPAEDGRIGLQEVLSREWDLLLLDVMLPEVDGFTLCRTARERHPRQPILLLTARGTEQDILEGFAAGADDYVQKPFSLAQEVARIKALLRRSGAMEGRVFELGGVHVDAARLQAQGALSGERLVLRRSVRMGEETWLQAVVLDRPALCAYIEDAVLSSSELRPWVHLAWAQGPRPPQEYAFSHTFAAPEGLRLRVRDFGPGLPARQLGRIFEPFFRGERELTRRTRGTGIGLALVKGLVAEMGGQGARAQPSGGWARGGGRLEG